MGNQTTFWHWNGTAWNASILNGFGGVAMWGDAPNNAWVVGYGIAHWDGYLFHVVKQPSLVPGGSLTAVSGSGPNDVWAVGGPSYGSGTAVHWDGSAWNVVANPSPANFLAVWDVGPDDAWATTGMTDPNTAFYHWNGTAWTSAFTTAGGWPGLWGDGSGDVGPWVPRAWRSGGTGRRGATRSTT